MTPEIIAKYFPQLPQNTAEKLASLKSLYADWNEKINVISRKDIEHFYERHVLHSLTMAHYVHFQKGNKVLDIGTGGGFPGIPLAIFFPETEFFLVDSIGKKIKVVQAVADALELKNVKTFHKRVEEIPFKVDYTVSRAVAVLPTLYLYSQKVVAKNVMKQKAIWNADKSEINSSLICLKGGDLNEEMSSLGKKLIMKNLSEVFKEEFFETKKLLSVQL
ncbi:MAG: rRNA ((527)-N(7))-methyltransferase RsmG [Bacteroidota bacterium]